MSLGSSTLCVLRVCVQLNTGRRERKPSWPRKERPAPWRRENHAVAVGTGTPPPTRGTDARRSLSASRWCAVALPGNAVTSYSPRKRSSGMSTMRTLQIFRRHLGIRTTFAVRKHKAGVPVHLISPGDTSPPAPRSHEGSPQVRNAVTVSHQVCLHCRSPASKWWLGPRSTSTHRSRWEHGGWGCLTHGPEVTGAVGADPALTGPPPWGTLP